MRKTLLALFSLAAAPAASDPVLSLPVDCDLGESCYIQQYTDRDLDAGFRDYTCGPLAYDGHKGTDFALATLAQMQAGVDVLAAAPGLVTGRRDGMADQIYRGDADTAVKGRECGNGVVLRHDDGWETQYCHLKLGSVRVGVGERVERGAVLGQIGLSGKTQFPHLHMSVRHNGMVVDPFDTADQALCGEGDGTLWQEPPAYTPGAVIDAGFAPNMPDYATIQAGTAARPNMPAESEALVLFGFLFGGQQGDEIDISIDGPNGPFASNRTTLDRDQARFFRAFGKRLRADAWPTGRYTGTVRLLRDGNELDSFTTTVDLR
ncbi:M23 family metallopeptidase [Lutimaribacter marinistellae]|uniref:M23 family metallopeptidase n=1 Tax=Lutimaribacter marinistellae TaxID=1820329 RepID=A0ABV7TNU5_9RHOB